MNNTNYSTEEKESNSQYTFWKLLSEYTIEIPIIQRDYAQGRDTAKPIRDELLDSIYTALVSESNLDFDFIYGTAKECEENHIKFKKLYPLDGQQRLTTLFLLHWYLAEKEHRMADARSYLKKFSYTTRISSREFCEMIVGVDYSPNSEQTVSEFIKNENRYFKAWDTDPTIKAMLTMLDDIHDKFLLCEPLFDKLIADAPALITFNYRAMEHYSLTDDLYIKMNARGKALSPFENFKAKFIQHMKKSQLSYQHFEDRIDSYWVHLLWDYRSPDNTVDKPFMNLLCYCTEMIFLLKEKPHDCDSPFKPNDIRNLISFYDSDEKVKLFYDMMDLWQSKEEAKNNLEQILSKERKKDKVRLFDGQPDIFSDIVLGKNVSVTNKILLFSIMMRLIKLGKETEKKSMLDYVRIVRNLLIQVRSFNNADCSFVSDFRFGRHGIPYVAFIMNYMVNSDSPYSVISGDYIEEYKINKEIYNHESQKAKIVISMSDLKELIQGLEDLDIFRGVLFNVLAYVVEDEDISLISDWEKLFSSEFSDDVIIALLSVGDYGIKVGSTYLGDKYFYGNKNRWYEILTYPGGKNYTSILSDFISQYQDNEEQYIEDALHFIAAENLKHIDASDWRYCLIKYPSTIKNANEISYSNLVFAFEYIYNSGIHRCHRMNGKTLNAYHTVPEYIEVASQLKGKCSPYVSGLNSNDMGCVYINSIPNGPIGIELDEYGLENVIQYEGTDVSLVEKTLEKYNAIDTTKLDRVEKLVLLGETAIEVFSAKNDNSKN
ncbi:MAG: DUF262 domain-containing protein [Ruminococcus sp.]|nr:DUF262 domain-containing protein [Ruminococcus sp.]